MTDPFPPDDELVSSYIDGEASPPEIVRVESSPDLMTRVTELRAIASVISEPVSGLDQLDIDRLIDSALDVSDTAANVVDLTAAVERRWWNQPRVLAVAAAVVLIALAVPVLRSVTDSGSESDFASTALESDFEEPTDGSEVADFTDSDSVTSQSAALPEAAALPETKLAPTEQSDADSPVAESAAGASAPSAVFGLPPTNPTFDPLPDELPPTADLVSLGAQVSGLLTDSDPRAADDVLAAGAIVSACGDRLAEALLSDFEGRDVDSALAVADYASVRIDGEEFVVVVVQIADEPAVGFTVDTATCSTVLPIPLTP